MPDNCYAGMKSVGTNHAEDHFSLTSRWVVSVQESSKFIDFCVLEKRLSSFPIMFGSRDYNLEVLKSSVYWRGESP